jgi:hypothetical protein
MGKLKPMKKLNGTITLLVSGDDVRLEINDDNSGCRFVNMRIDPVDFCKLLGRQAGVHCTFEVPDLSLIGQYEVITNIEFPIPTTSSRDSNRTNIATETVLKLPEVVEDGWHPSMYFSSQGSFFTKKVDGEEVHYARTTLSKWVDLETAKKFNEMEGYNVHGLNKIRY